MLGNREREWEEIGMSIWEYNGNRNKRLAGMGMGIGLKLIGVGKNGKLKSIPAHL